MMSCTTGHIQVNYDEKKVPDYTLPPLPIGSPGDASLAKYRQEVISKFEEFVYGRTPELNTVITSELLWEDTLAMDGLATMKEVCLRFTAGSREVTSNLLISIPNNSKKVVPVFTGLNFYGNQTVSSHPDIRVTEKWTSNNEAFGIAANRATEASRGARVHRWPLRYLNELGYGMVTAYYGDYDPDFDDEFKNGVHALDASARKSDSWASIAAWAWGLSRILDYLLTETRIDDERIFVMGHSRLGKAALWAGAQDERFAAVISNNSGCGGAALSRRKFGETVRAINMRFPHWFCENFHLYNDREEELPVDQHQLLGLIAPRPLYVASASNDQWADPMGEYLSWYHASFLYKDTANSGQPSPALPPADTQIISGRTGYHLRTGEHDITQADWKFFVEFFNRFR